MFGRAEPGSTVTLDGRAVRVAEDGRFVFGFGREAPATAVLEVRGPSGAVERRRLEIRARQFDVQHVDGLPQNLVTPDAEEEARIQREQAAVLEARKLDLDRPLFASGFIWPALGPISGVYGSQRILNGEPRAPHYGVDVAAPEGSPVRAPADGVVTFARPDLLLTGGTLVIDHGHGLSSTFIHLSRIEVAAGAEVKQGEVVGAVGATGRATGPHLHWGMNWFETRLDPQLLVGQMPAQPTD
jgi:murein DD-endopeptidase MepM/ murein hydrolase activator NlpD